MVSITLDDFSDICAAGEGFNDKLKCVKCQENTYSNNVGRRCKPCKDGYDTQGRSGETQCQSMSLT